MNDSEIQKIRDTAFCSGYNTAVSKYEKQNKELLEENAELKQENKVLAQNLEDTEIINKALEKENAELRKVAEFQQSSNMSRHFENKKLKEGLAIGSTFNKALNSMNKNLEEERDKYRNMVFDKDENLTKAKEIIKNLMVYVPVDLKEYEEAKQFLNENSTYERIQKAKYNYID